MQTVQTREEFLIELKKELPRNVDAVEIGVYQGEFAKMILDIIQPSSLVLVDPFEENDEYYGEFRKSLRTAYSKEEDYQILISRLYAEIENKNVIIDKRFSYDAVNDYADDCFELIYVDASHLYPDAKRDFNEWKRKLSIFGFMCGHDYNNDNGFGVVQAVDEFMKENNFEMFLLNTNGGDFALREI